MILVIFHTEICSLGAKMLKIHNKFLGNKVCRSEWMLITQRCDSYLKWLLIRKRLEIGGGSGERKKRKLSTDIKIIFLLTVICYFYYVA